MRSIKAIAIICTFIPLLTISAQGSDSYKFKPESSEYSRATILTEISREEKPTDKSRLKYQISDIMNSGFRDLFRMRKETYNFDVVSSLGSNVSFGGMHENYAFINFTPQMFIRPAGFIQIYANHNLLKVVPLENINSAAASLLMQGLLLVAADNATKYILNEKTWISELVCFTVKNLLMGLLVKPVVKSSNRKMIPWIQDESFYYSLSLRF